MTRLAQNPVVRTILLFFHSNLGGADVPEVSGFDDQPQVAGGSGWRSNPEPSQRQSFGADRSS